MASLLGAAAIENLRRLSGGASRETFSFDAVGADGAHRPLILQRDRPGALQGGTARAHRVLNAAAKAGVPVPGMVTASDDPGVLGAAFLVTERVEGETIPRKILRDDEYAAARPRLAAQCGEILARVHATPLDDLGHLGEEDEVTRYRQIMDDLGQPHPAFELAFRWLDDHRPPAAGRTLVHGDFRNGNLIVGPDGVRAVLDWELAHIGDPLEDLGWLCVKAWRFGQVDQAVGGFGQYDDLVTAYERAGGVAVDRDALLWWETLGTLKWGVMCIMQTTAHTSGAVRSVELAAIGRRVCENEWDVLLCLERAAQGKGLS